MGIYEKDVIHYSLNDETTNEEIFLKFIQDLQLKLKEKKIVNYTLFLDNLSVHKTSKLIKYYAEQKINIIFNIPYFSNFRVMISFKNGVLLKL